MRGWEIGAEGSGVQERWRRQRERMVEMKRNRMLRNILKVNLARFCMRNGWWLMS